MGPCGPVRTVAVLCSGKERPGWPWAGCLWDLVPVLKPHANRGSLRGA